MYGSAAIGATHVKAHRSAAGAKGAFNNAIGRSRGTNALTDDIGRPLAIMITPGNTHELAAAQSLIGIVRQPRRLLASAATSAIRGSNATLYLEPLWMFCGGLGSP